MPPGRTFPPWPLAIRAHLLTLWLTLTGWRSPRVQTTAHPRLTLC
jgi:hypothetical protein